MDHIQEDIKEDVEEIFNKKRVAMDLRRVVLEVSFLEHAPIVDAFVYGEAFPFSEPQKIVLDIVEGDAGFKELEEIICEELVHIKYPHLKHETKEFEQMIKKCKEIK